MHIILFLSGVCKYTLCGEVLQLTWSNNANHSFLAQVVVFGLALKALS